MPLCLSGDQLLAHPLLVSSLLAAQQFLSIPWLVTEGVVPSSCSTVLRGSAACPLTLLILIVLTTASSLSCYPPQRLTLFFCLSKEKFSVIMPDFMEMWCSMLKSSHRRGESRLTLPFLHRPSLFLLLCWMKRSIRAPHLTQGTPHKRMPNLLIPLPRCRILFLSLLMQYDHSCPAAAGVDPDKGHQSLKTAKTFLVHLPVLFLDWPHAEKIFIPPKHFSHWYFAEGVPVMVPAISCLYKTLQSLLRMSRCSMTLWLSSKKPSLRPCFLWLILLCCLSTKRDSRYFQLSIFFIVTNPHSLKVFKMLQLMSVSHEEQAHAFTLGVHSLW